MYASSSLLSAKTHKIATVVPVWLLISEVCKPASVEQEARNFSFQIVMPRWAMK